MPPLSCHKCKNEVHHQDHDHDDEYEDMCEIYIRHRRRRKFSPNLQREDTIRVTKVNKITLTRLSISEIIVTKITIRVGIVSFSYFRLTWRQRPR